MICEFCNNRLTKTNSNVITDKVHYFCNSDCYRRYVIEMNEQEVYYTEDGSDYETRY